MTQVTRSPDCANSAQNRRIENIALALMGEGDLPDAALSEGAVWDRSGGAVLGRPAIQQARENQPTCKSIRIEQVVSHGKAGTASGVLTRPDGSTRLFCHVIRFTRSENGETAQMVSFEHAHGRKNG